MRDSGDAKDGTWKSQRKNAQGRVDYAKTRNCEDSVARAEREGGIAESVVTGGGRNRAV